MPSYPHSYTHPPLSPLPSTATQVQRTKAAARQVITDAAPVAHYDPTALGWIAGLNPRPGQTCAQTCAHTLCMQINGSGTSRRTTRQSSWARAVGMRRLRVREPRHHTTCATCATTPPHHHATTPPRHHVTTSPRHHTTTQPRPHATMPPRHHTTMPPRHHTTRPPRHHATTPPRHRATTPPRHHATTNVTMRRDNKT